MMASGEGVVKGEGGELILERLELSGRDSNSHLPVNRHVAV